MLMHYTFHVEFIARVLPHHPDRINTHGFQFQKNLKLCTQLCSVHYYIDDVDPVPTMVTLMQFDLFLRLSIS